MFNTSDGLFPDVNRREGVAEGVAFVDPAGVNLQVCYDTSRIQRYFDFYDVCMLVFGVSPTKLLLVILSLGNILGYFSWVGLMIGFHCTTMRCTSITEACTVLSVLLKKSDS